MMTRTATGIPNLTQGEVRFFTVPNSGSDGLAAWYRPDIVCGRKEKSGGEWFDVNLKYTTVNEDC